MKQLFLFFIIICSLNTYSQDTIYLKNGTKIIPRVGVNKYYGTPLTTIEDGKRVTYAVQNSGWSKSVKSKDLDYALAGGRLLKTFELKYNDDGVIKTSEPIIYYVSIENEKYSLITTSYSKDLIVPIVQIFVIDKDNKIVESASYVAGNTKKDDINRNKTVEMIKKYFSNIEEEMEFLDYCKSINKNEETGIQAYLDNHLYKKYIAK